MRERVALAAVFAGFVAMVVWFARLHWDSVYDDALIYLRYVRNLHAGCGLRFNCDQPPVEGFTSPLYLGLLYGGSLATDQLISLSQVIGTLSLIGAGGFALLAARRFGPWVAAATLIALALDPFVLLNANIGMETSLGALVVAVIAFAVLTDRPWLLAIVAALATLVRPEGLLFALALPIVTRDRKQLATAGAIVVAICALRELAFGALLPNTYYAKSGGTWRHVELGAAYIVDCAIDFPLALLAPLVLLRDRSRPVVYLLAVAGAWLMFFLRSGGDLFEYSRLWFPLVPVLSALALAGLNHRRWIPLVVAVAIGGRAAIEHHIPEQHANPRVVAWAALGTYLRQHYPHQLIAAVPIGAIGYYSGLPLIDLVGLTEPEIARSGNGVPPELLAKRWIGHERHDTAYVLARAPRVIATTMHRTVPWAGLEEARAGFYADWLLLQEIKAGRAPYHVVDAAISPTDHYLLFERDAGR